MWLTAAEVDAALSKIHDVNDAAFAPMQVVVGMYANANHVCELDLDLDRWRQVYSRMGRAQLLIEQAATKYLPKALGFRPRKSPRRAQGATQ